VKSGPAWHPRRNREVPSDEETRRRTAPASGVPRPQADVHLKLDHTRVVPTCGTGAPVPGQIRAGINLCRSPVFDIRRGQGIGNCLTSEAADSDTTWNFMVHEQPASPASRNAVRAHP